MIKGPKLINSQWELLANAFSNMGQAIILFSLAAFFVPETLGLSRNFSTWEAIIFLLNGLFLLGFAGIIIRKGKQNG